MLKAANAATDAFRPLPDLIWKSQDDNICIGLPGCTRKNKNVNKNDVRVRSAGTRAPVHFRTVVEALS